MPRYRQFGNGVFVDRVKALFGCSFNDLCYGYHAFWKYCLESIDLRTARGVENDTVLYVGALRKRPRIAEVPSFEGYRFDGMGKLRTIPDGFRVPSSIMREWVSSLRTSRKAGYIGFRGAPPHAQRSNIHARLTPHYPLPEQKYVQ